MLPGVFAAEFGDPVVAQHLVDILIRTREFVDIFRNRLEKAPDIDLLDPVGIGDPEVLRAQAVVRLAQAPGQTVEFVVRLAEGLLHGAELPVAGQHVKPRGDGRDEKEQDDDDQHDVHRVQAGVALAVSRLDLRQDGHGRATSGSGS